MDSRLKAQGADGDGMATPSTADLCTMIDTLPTLVWRADAQGAAEYFNRTWLEYAGVTIDEVRGAGWARLLHPDEVEWFVEQWRGITASGKPGCLEGRLRRHDGVYRWHLFRAAPSLDDAGKVAYWFGTNTDIEDLKRAEVALRESEQRFRLIVDCLPGLVATMTAEGEIEHVNQRILDYGGTTLEDLRDWRAWIHPDELAHVSAAWRHAFETGEPYDIEHRARGTDGTYRWFHVRGLPYRDVDGRILRWYVLLADIEDRKRVEQTLAASERTLRLLFESIPGMIAVNAADGGLEYVNRRLLDFVGVDLAYLTDLGWARVLHPEDADAAVQEWQRSFQSGEPLDVMFRIRRADGVYRWFQARSEPRVDEHGRIAGWYALLWDIEDRKQAEEALRRSETQLARISRVVTMGELTASIAHEINQPLSAVAHNADACLLLMSETDPPLAEIRDGMTEIVADAHRASGIIARVRKLASKAPLERIRLDLRDVVLDVLALARHESDSRRVTMRSELPEALPAVVGDRVQLQQVLLNLVMNAMDASSAVAETQRIVTIRADSTLRDGGREAVVSVEDAGIGIGPEDMTRLFEAFHTTKPQGMGMGLAISRSIIAAHGGRLWAECNQGPGATFRFSLPAAGNAASGS